MIHRFCIAALALTVVVGCQSGQGANALKGAMAPDFELAALGGGTVRLSEMRGKPVLLSFWGHF